MRKYHLICNVLATFLFTVASEDVSAQPAMRELKVHLAQANNDSPYSFVRASFEPGELVDPWSVRFFDGAGTELPYFVWDSVTWQVAREGRADWGNRYALINHAPGESAEVRSARSRKLETAKGALPELVAKLEAKDRRAQQAGDSICAAMYLLQKQVPAFGKQRVTLRIYPERQVEPKRQSWPDIKNDQRVTVASGALQFAGLPDRLSVVWQGIELFQSAGFDAGSVKGTVSHVDISRPFKIEFTEGLVTKLTITGQTSGRGDKPMNWQCTYWLFPQGAYVGLEGFALGEVGQYLGGGQKLSIWQAAKGFSLTREPLWDRPWWLHQVGERGFTATHLFFATPLAVGFGNNPFAVNAEGPDKEPRVELDGGRLALRWRHEVNDPAIARLMTPQRMVRPSSPAAATPPKNPGWQVNTDWLYRQYVVGVGKKADQAEGALRNVLGAAAGWIDRPIDEEETARLLTRIFDQIKYGFQSSEINRLTIVPRMLAGEVGALSSAPMPERDPVGRTDQYIHMMQLNVAEGGKPAGGSKQLPDGSRREGWTGNTCYHASQMPVTIRVLEYFDASYPKAEFDRAIVRFADVGLELLGGNPVDLTKLNTTLRGEWPSRVVPTIPLMLHANMLKSDERYTQVAKRLFDDLLDLVKRNPHGYFPAWSFTPKADNYDTVYNPVSYERGIASFWSEDQLNLIGRKQAEEFVAAQARWFVFSGQLLDTLEMDNTTAIRACTHGGHTSVRNQIGIYLQDDFAFYRGLLGNLVEWSAIAAQDRDMSTAVGVGTNRQLIVSDSGSAMLRWALDIRPGTRVVQSKVERLAQRPDFRVQAWDRRDKPQPIKIAAEQIGLESGGQVFEVQLNEPVYRVPAEIKVERKMDKLFVSTSRAARLRLYPKTLSPTWPENFTFQLRLKQMDGNWKPVEEGARLAPEYFEWDAVAGNYELTPEKSTGKTQEKLPPKPESKSPEKPQAKPPGNSPENSQRGNKPPANVPNSPEAPRQVANADAPKWQEQASTGLIPLNAMTGSASYKGEEGGLYGGGNNLPPEKQLSAALQASRQITKVDAEGKPSPDGKIVFISLGMSNTAGEFMTFKEIADRDPDKSPDVSIVNCAVGGAGVRSWTQASSGTWSKSLDSLRPAHFTPAQVQVAWIKHAEPMPDEDQNPLEYAKKVKADIATSLDIAKTKFPNLKIAYLSSRIYGGYNSVGRRRVNPEPFAYETAFSVRWVIQDQINGRAHNFDPQRGRVVAPVLLWGPYLWADGVKPRPSDGLVWQCADFGQDGVHPTRDGGAVKVAKMLLDFCKNDPTAKTWFIQSRN